MSSQPKVTKVKKEADKASRSEPPQSVGAVQTCPNQNWIEVIYKYDSRRAVSNASYEIFDANTNQSLACGKLNNMGFARVEKIPNNVTSVNFLFTSDPKDFEPFPGYKPYAHHLTPDTKEIKEEDGTIVSVAKWLGGSLAGDFVDDQSFGQIAFGTVVTMIPVVDQVGDVRDIIANLYKLTFERKYGEFSPWFSLVVTVIGCVPEIGTAIKGVVKSIYKWLEKGAKKLPLKRLMRLMNSIGEGNVIRFLREFLGNIAEHGQNVTKKILKIVEEIQTKLRRAKHFAFFKAEEKIENLLKHVDEVYKRTPEMVRKVIDWIAKHLKNTLDEVEDFMMRGTTRMRNGARQLKERIFKIGRNVDLTHAAKEAGMDPNDVERLVKHCKDRDRLVVVRFTNPESLKYHNMPNHVPKPLDVKLKTSKRGEHAGLVMAPGEGAEKWEKENFEYLTKEKGYKVDSEGCMVDPNGNRIYGDHDVQSVHQKVEDEYGEKAYLQDQANPTDSSTIADLNEGGDAKMYQHGAQDNYMVKTDEYGDIVKDSHGKPIPATVEDMNAGRAKIGRQPGKDEKFLVVDEEGNMKVIDSPQELEDFHKAHGMIWEYDPTEAIGPAGKAEAVAGAERAMRSSESQNDEN